MIYSIRLEGAFQVIRFFQTDTSYDQARLSDNYDAKAGNVLRKELADKFVNMDLKSQIIEFYRTYIGIPLLWGSNLSLVILIFLMK